MKDNFGYYQDHYEQSEIWGEKSLTAHQKKLSEQERVKQTLSYIPEDVSTILDVGCGDGRITNELSLQYQTIGIDISWESLKHVKSPKIRGTVACLPFHDKTFDLVLCTEVLEHLPYGVYEEAIEEIQRVGKKYIVISVPYDEILEWGLVKCAYCGCVFHSARHLRSFNLRKLENLLSQFRMVKYLPFGMDVKYYNRLLIRIRHFFGAWYVTPMSLCPQCGNNTSFVQQRNLITLACAALNRIFWLFPSSTKKRWIIALYQRNKQEE